jgi:hypothetical protein
MDKTAQWQDKEREKARKRKENNKNKVAEATKVSLCGEVCTTPTPITEASHHRRNQTTTGTPNTAICVPPLVFSFWDGDDHFS